VGGPLTVAFISTTMEGRVEGENAMRVPPPMPVMSTKKAVVTLSITLKLI
jgi:hypothetical protein